MTIESDLFSNNPSLEAPQGIAGWIGWVVCFGILLYLLWRWRKYNKPWGRLQWGILFLLLLLIPLSTLLVVRLPISGALPLSDKPLEPTSPTVVVFFALPWMLAAGWLGMFPAAFIGLLSGLLLAIYETHNPVTILAVALWAVLLAAALQQRYRTRVFRLLRHPWVASSLLALLYPFFFYVENLLVVGGNLANRLDYIFTWALPAWGAAAIELVLAGLLVEFISQATARWWGGGGTLQPSPIEQHLRSRFISRIIPLMVGLLIALVVGDWMVANRAATRMLEDRLESSAEMASHAVLNFLETGHSLILQYAADNIWYQATVEQISAQLSQNLRDIPFFNELYVLDSAGNPLAGTPLQNFMIASPSPEEYFGVNLALNGVLFQYYTTAPVMDGAGARMSFMAPVFDTDQQVRAVLIGRTDLATNPLLQPAISALQSLNSIEGVGMLIDEDGRIVYHSQKHALLEDFSGQISDGGLHYDAAAPNGTRRLVYTQPVEGRSWAIAAEVPARQSQQLALEIATPTLLMVLLVISLVTVLLLVSLRSVTTALSNLAMEANRLSSGQLEQPLLVEGEDEVGQLSKAFELMRANLKTRLDELNRLVVVSQGVSASLEFEEAVAPILEAALTTGASSARVVLSPDAVPETQGSATPVTHFGDGPAGELYAWLDEQILNLALQQERIVITNLPRVRLFNFPQGSSRPESVLALPLRHEHVYSGTLWLAYDTPHQFSEDEIRFVITLASQAALASSNARLFARAEVGRQRLAAILDFTPDPVLVTDHRDCLLLANPAAWQALGLGVDAAQGQPIKHVLPYADLVRLLGNVSVGLQSAEIELTDGKIYLAMASSVLVDEHPMGRVCTLRDITHFKELDAMKSDFVSTVSHDLRSPLALINGYATMLEMVGDLNEQQMNYAHRIMSGVESMTHLVNTLLDLGRIEAGVDIQLEMVSIHDLVERVVASVQLEASQRRIDMTTKIDSLAPPLVEADPALLQQALHNLLENAIRYTEPGGKVSMDVMPDQDHVTFEIRDNGIGIAPVDLPRIFEKFYRVGQAEVRRRQGTGLGLAIVKSIAERHKGRVWVESQLGKGSSFFLRIPFRRREHKGHQ